MLSTGAPESPDSRDGAAAATMLSLHRATIFLALSTPLESACLLSLSRQQAISRSRGATHDLHGCTQPRLCGAAFDRYVDASSAQPDEPSGRDHPGEVGALDS